MTKYAVNSGLGRLDGPPPVTGEQVHVHALDFYDDNLVAFTDRLDELVAAWALQAELLRQWGRGWALEGYQQRDADVLASWVSDDFVQDDPMNLGRIVRGREAYRQVMLETFTAFPDSAFVPIGAPCLSLDGSTLVLPWRAIGHFTGPLAWGPPGKRKTFAPTGRRFDFEGTDFYTFRDGKVATLRSRYDPLQVLEQLGMLPNRDGLLFRLAPYAQTALASLTNLRKVTNR